jgi:hypothetical protein
MSTDTSIGVTDATDTFGGTWLVGAVAGVAAGAAMAVWLVVLSPATIAVAIPRLYGLSGMLTGWAVHLTHGAVFGAGFAAIALGADSRPVVALLGLAYGLVLWFVAAGTLMPIWLASVGFPAAPPVPNLEPVVLGAHLVYGVVLGALFPVLADR